MALTSAQSADADAYGTFAGHIPSATSSATPPPDAGRPSKLLRVVGLASVLALAGSCLSRLSSSPSASPQLSTATSSVRTPSTARTSSAAQLSPTEQMFLDNVDRPHIREFLHAYASVPHTCGTAQDHATALYTQSQWESYGLEAEVVRYDTLLSYPVHRRLSILSTPADGSSSSPPIELDLSEPPVPGDACTSDPTALPPFLAYAASGKVTAPVVYANFGRSEDFQWLLDRNVTLQSKIALVRYGGSMRGIKVMLAEQHGMAATLIYSDPADDGFGQGPVYPEGSFRPRDSFQRGSVSYPAVAPGDPLTPGWASVPGAHQLSYDGIKGSSVPSTPALPLSYGLAHQILSRMRGLRAPETWQGGLQAELEDGYRVGDDDGVVLSLELEMDTRVTPIWDVIGTVRGSAEPDKVVVIGNHRDAWVCGAVDPSSGSATMMEIARGLGELLRTGWRPRRSIQLGSWDGEEYNLIGSTEWAEDNADRLGKHAVAYLNVDLLLGPLVAASGAPSIAKFVQDVARLVPANEFYGEAAKDGAFESLLDQWTNQMATMRAETGAGVQGTLAPDFLINFMGSGSDFTPFYQHLGVISVNLAFGLTYASYGTYHSSMDSVRYMETQGDPLYASHASMAKWWGLLTLRLADDPLIPFDFSTYGLVMASGLDDYAEQLKARHQGDVDLSELRGAIRSFSAAADALTELTTALGTAKDADAQVLGQVNDKLTRLERHLLSPEGLPHRKWYKHVIFGPGYYAGYAGAAFPGIGDAIAFEDDSLELQQHVDEVARVVQGAADFLAQ